MENFRSKVALRRPERVESGEVDVHFKLSTSIGRIIGTHNGCFPEIPVICLNRTGWAALVNGIFLKVVIFLLDSLEGHFLKIV